MSKVPKKRPPTASGAGIGPSSSKKQRLVNATKMLLDIAKESSDALPPLKSCLGGISALIKHYEESKDVEERLGDLIPWLTKLKGSVPTASADDSREEAQRREELTRSLGDIEKQSQALLARIPDETGDSGAAVKLIEQLRQAILVYQLSQQRSTDGYVSKLAIPFNDFLKRSEIAPEVRGKIESTLARLGRLDFGGSTVEDEGESKRRMVLLEALEGIKDKLHPISERSNAAGYRENDGDLQAVCELTENVRDTIIEYQLAHQKAGYEQNCKMIDPDERTVLDSCRRAHGAGFLHGNRNSCLKGTRESVLNEIERWAEDLDAPPVFWLNGLAGTGKSTIAQTIAERIFADGRLGASFICSRGVEDRSNLHLVFPTLAFQLAQKYPAFRSSLIPTLRSNPDVVHESLLSQMQRLIVEPLRSAGVPTVIVIDGLDECKNEDPESAILLVLGQLVSEIPKVKFFVTSRPEPQITSGFRGPLLKKATSVFILHQIEPSTVDNDIRHFFKHELSKLTCQPGGSDDWPTDEQVDALCRRAASFFVYAVAAVGFLKRKFRRPSDQLEVIMTSPEIVIHEGQAGLKAHNSLDSLYTSILRAAFLENNVDDGALARSVLSALVLVTNPLSPSAIATLMGLGLNVVTSLLESLQSLVVLQGNAEEPIQLFHRSFPDFVTDSSRCSDPRFHISADFHTELVLRCLGLMNMSLKKKMFSIPDYALNSDVEGLPRVEESGVDSALVYACKSWFNHLVSTERKISDVLSDLRRFLEEKFTFWLEVLSVLGAVGDAARALTTTLEWLNRIEVPVDLKTLFDITRDCLRFVTEFFEVISESAPHIYHSALPLVPASSVIQKLYGQYISSAAKVVTGSISASWDSCTTIAGTTLEFGLGPCYAIWSPCGQIIAAGLESGDIEVRDSTTLEILYHTLRPPHLEFLCPNLLAFSPDGYLLVCAYEEMSRREGSRSCKLVAWDVQAGIVVKELATELVVASSSWDDFKHKRMAEFAGRVHTFLKDDTLDPRALVEDQRIPEGVASSWIREGSLYFATGLRTGDEFAISIHEFRPTSTPSHPVVDSFHVPYHAQEFSFSPVSSHASFVAHPNVIILDVRDSTTLLRIEDTEESYYPPGLFSPDGCFFACRTGMDDICVWKNTAAGYTPWSTLRPQSLLWFSFSPTAPSILIWGPTGVQSLRLDNRVDPLTPEIATRDFLRRNHLVTISLDGTRIATARREGRTITILDPLSGTPQNTIDAGLQIQDMKLVHNAIVVLGKWKLVRWKLKTDSAGKAEVESKVPIDLGLVERLTLSNDGSRIACVRNKFLMYDVESDQIIGSYRPPKTFGPVKGVRFSRCGSKLWFWSVTYDQSFDYPSIEDGHVLRVEIEGGRFASSSAHDLRDEWSSLDFLRSCDGFRIGRGSRWVEDSAGRKLFWLPPSWRAGKVDEVVWEGNFLALVDGCVRNEPIIIQFQP